MEYKAKEFKLLERVKFVNTGCEILDAMCGNIIGVPNNPLQPAPHYYIVALDDDYCGSMAINITEVCLTSQERNNV